MSQNTGPQLIEYGGKGQSYWAQAQCQGCLAWLREMPNSFEPAYWRKEKEITLFTYYWTCLSCFQTRIVETFSPPDSYSPNPNGVEHKPGSFPEPVSRDPSEWGNSDQLSKLEQTLVNYCWVMIDSLKGKLIVHKINYIWKLAAALERYEIGAVVRAAQEYINLLDYEKIHGKEPGSYYGEEGEVTKIREVLKKIGRN